MTAPSHAPSERLGACDPCRRGDHAGCWSIVSPAAEDDCTCYDDRWEWHETLARTRDPGR
jgi:hypothetical protein